MSTTTNLFESLNQPRTAILDALKGLSEQQLDQKGIVGEWSIKNTLAHLVAWESAVTSFLPDRLATGARPAIFTEIGDSEDAWNTRQVALREHLTPTKQLSELARTRQKLLEWINALGDETLQRTHPWPEWESTLAEYIRQNIGEHEQEHSEAIVAGVKQLRG